MQTTENFFKMEELAMDFVALYGREAIFEKAEMATLLTEQGFTVDEETLNDFIDCVENEIREVFEQ